MQCMSGAADPPHVLLGVLEGEVRRIRVLDQVWTLHLKL